MPKKRKRKAKRGDSGLFQLVTSGVALGGAAVVAYLHVRGGQTHCVERLAKMLRL
jgi:hypothetical protein